MTAKKDDFEIASPQNLAAIVAAKLASVPQGFTPEQLARTVKEGQSATLAERSIDDFLKIMRTTDRRIVRRLTVTSDDISEDFYDADVINVGLVKRFCSPDDNEFFDAFIDSVSDTLMSRHGRFLDAFENIAAGRTKEDTGLFRGIFNSVAARLFSDKEKQK